MTGMVRLTTLGIDCDGMPIYSIYYIQRARSLTWRANVLMLALLEVGAEIGQQTRA